MNHYKNLYFLFGRREEGESLVSMPIKKIYIYILMASAQLLSDYLFQDVSGSSSAEECFTGTYALRANLNLFALVTGGTPGIISYR